MTLMFMKDGREIECPTAHQAKPGQVLVMTFVSFPKDHILSTFAQPALFTVVSVEKPDWPSEYTLQSTSGTVLEKISLGIGFYDVAEWLKWDKAKREEDERRAKARIAHLESQLQLLRGILVDQGVKLITPAQAASLQLDLKK